MIRVTGSNSLMMTPLTAMSGSDATAETEKLTELLTGTDSDSSSTISSDCQTIQELTADIYNIAGSLLDTDSDSLFSSAEESGDTSTVVTYIQKFVSQYNDLLSSLLDYESTTGTSYADELQSIMSNYQSALEDIGITIGSDGTLSVDKDTLSASSLEDLHKLFQGTDSLSAEIADKSIYVGAGITAYSAETSTTYSSSGTTNYDEMASTIGSYLDSLG